MKTKISLLAAAILALGACSQDIAGPAPSESNDAVGGAAAFAPPGGKVTGMPTCYDRARQADGRELKRAIHRAGTIESDIIDTADGYQVETRYLDAPWAGGNFSTEFARRVEYFDDADVLWKVEWLPGLNHALIRWSDADGTGRLISWGGVITCAS